MTDSKEYPSTVADKYVVRFPEGMRDRISEAAKSNNRSMNAEIVARLEDSLDGRERYATKAQIERLLQKLASEQEARNVVNVTMLQVMSTAVIDLYRSLPQQAPAREKYEVPYQLAQSIFFRESTDLPELLSAAVDGEQSPEQLEGIASILRESRSLRDRILNSSGDKLGPEPLDVSSHPQSNQLTSDKGSPATAKPQKETTKGKAKAGSAKIEDNAPRRRILKVPPDH